MKNAFAKLRQLEHHVDDTVRIYSNCETDDYPPHWHNSYEIILPMENQYTVLIADKVHVIEPGDIMVIPPGSVHELYAPESGWRYFFLVDREEVFAFDGLKKIQSSFYPCVHLSRTDETLNRSETLDVILDHLFCAIQESMNNDPLSKTARQLHLGLALVEVGRFVQKEESINQENGRHSEMRAAYLAACMYISENCDKALTLEEVAERSGYSRYHFARLFKSYAGMGFYDYFMQQRLLLCKQLLTDTTLSVTEVAMRSGFGSIATFNRVFKVKEGVTPTEFRRMQQSRPENRNI
ncbi:MAG: AraC family transcriptional regulator [Clostridia bacterium]|nr:AraC family transcriptional regulator [Clostridia bacterium]